MRPVRGPFRINTDHGNFFIWFGMGVQFGCRNSGRVFIRLLRAGNAVNNYFRENSCPLTSRCYRIAIWPHGICTRPKWFFWLFTKKLGSFTTTVVSTRNYLDFKKWGPFGVIALERLISKIYVKRIAKGSVRDGIETVRWGSFTGMQELDLLNKINIFTLLNIFLCLN